ncbi:hypothetical protein ABGB19_12725 [Mycobacterium sp. B14F4]|uniref:hypothetical protein n=1 Tax=Mycobacterium sp. B14F4 TaxID=3153565 RepID=UPI00325E42EE
MLTVLWAPVALVIPDFPDLAGAAGIETFYAEHADMMRLILLSISVGFIAFLIFLGRLVVELPFRDSGWTWTALAGALMFMTALCVAVGVDAAAVLLFERASPEAVWVSHSVAFLLAAPAAGAGSAFFIAVAALAFEGHWPRSFGWLAVVGALVNLAAVAGFLSLTGAPNSGNGLLGGLAGPVAVWVVWILAVSVRWLRHPSTVRQQSREPFTSGRR